MFQNNQMKVSVRQRKSHSKKRTARTAAVIERTQALSEDPGQSLRKLASIVGVSEPTMRRIAAEDLRYKEYIKDRSFPRLPGPSELLAAKKRALLIAQI